MPPREILDENKLNSWVLPDPTINILGTKYAIDLNMSIIDQIQEIAEKTVLVDVFSIWKSDEGEYRVECSIGYFYAKIV